MLSLQRLGFELGLRMKVVRMVPHWYACIEGTLSGYLPEIGGPFFFCLLWTGLMGLRIGNMLPMLSRALLFVYGAVFWYVSSLVVDEALVIFGLAIARPIIDAGRQ